MIYAYERVSTKKQNTARQDRVLKNKLKERGISSIDKIFTDKMTGKTTEKEEQLETLLKTVEPGDIVYCESISRLGRNLKDLIEIIEHMTEKGVQVIILKEGIDTNNSTYKLLLAIFGGVAEMERETIQERVTQRIDQLKEDKENGEINTKTGKWFGREKLTKENLPATFPKYYNMMREKKITKVEMARLLGIGRDTVYRWIKLYEQDN